MDHPPAGITYVSFDVFPAPKGAAVHIEAFARALGAAFGPLDLVTVAARPGAASSQPWLDAPVARPLDENVIHHAIAVRGPNLIARVLHFRAQLASWWQRRARSTNHRPHVVHVRSIFEGYPIACHKKRLCDKLVYEANGLPSIELKYHYAQVAEDRELLAKLRRQELALIEAADLLVTPSAVTAAELERRGAPADRVQVIPNGVDAEQFPFRPPPPWQGRPLRLLYIGTMTRWQGVHHAIEALWLLRRDHPASLTLVGPARRGQRQQILARCRELALAPHVELLRPMLPADLREQYHRADVALVPLPVNDRNTVQGCCPLKLIEAMAAGVPVVASDLPVVAALARHDVEALLVRPGSAKAIKDGCLRLLHEPGLAERLARAARQRVERQLTWRHATDKLVAAYEAQLGKRRRSSSPSTNSS